MSGVGPSVAPILYLWTWLLHPFPKDTRDDRPYSAKVLTFLCWSTAFSSRPLFTLHPAQSKPPFLCQFGAMQNSVSRCLSQPRVRCQLSKSLPIYDRALQSPYGMPAERARIKCFKILRRKMCPARPGLSRIPVADAAVL